MSVKKDIVTRIYISFGLMVLLGLGIMVQAVRIQTVQGAYYRDMADSLTTAYRNIEAVRGNIYAADGSLLATSVPIYDVRMDTKVDGLTNDIFENKVDSLAQGLSRIFGDYSAREYARKIREARRAGKRNFLVRRNIDYQQLQAVKQLPIFNMGRYTGGLVVEQKTKREMPFRHLARRTIGYAISGVAPVGLEGAFDDQLAGVGGKRLMQKIAGGVWLPINDRDEIEPRDGNDIVTTIDINIQDVTEAALLRALERNQADHGCAIVMEVATGQIKAIANLGRDADGSVYYEKYNYAIGESAEPGSTFKLASMMVALERGDVKLTDSVDLEKGTFRFYDRIMRDSEKHDYNNMSVADLFAISSNVGISKIINNLYGGSPQVFVEGLHKLGLGELTGIEITGEGKSVIKNPKEKGWSGVTLPWMSVGYEVRLSPLQTLAFYNAVANGGTMMRPYLVREIREFGDVRKRFEPQVMKSSIASKSTIEQAQALLALVVEKGTGKNIQGKQYTAAGKTGTALIADNSLGYKGKIKYRASFAGYFPADAPRYSVIVVVANPTQGSYYGGTVAGPVFKEIADKVYASHINPYLEEGKGKRAPKTHIVLKNGRWNESELVLRKLKIDYSGGAEGEWMHNVSSDSLQLTDLPLASTLVPQVYGMGLKDAMYLLENAGLRVVPVGRGRVTRQSLKAGSRHQKNQQIVIELS
ncbi:MAG: penicillin-binding protein [Sphingobacteriaceae bacterium]|nr:penicillin-binding protein [Sphingobacteriaceae bacterium]